jgi:hypothetical protein
MVKRLLGPRLMNASGDSQQRVLHGRRLLKVISLAVGLGLLASSAGIWWGLLTNTRPQLVADFLSLYAGGRLLWQDRTHLYNLERQLAVETSILAPDGLPKRALPHHYQVLPYNYPPFFTLLLVPLSWLPFPLAYVIASVLNLLCLAVTLRLLLQRLALGLEQSRWLLIVAFCAAAIYVTLIQGQTSLLALLLLTLYVLDLQERRGVRAGVWAGLLLFKPQLLPLPLVILAWRRCWRGLLTLLVVLASLVLVSLALVGVEGLQQHVLLVRQMASAEGTLGIHPGAMHNLRALARFSLPRPWDSVGWWGSSALLALITLWVHRPSVRDGQGSAWRWSATIVLLLLLTPHLNTHDLALLLLPCALVLSTYNGPIPIPMVAAWVGLSLLPLLTSALPAITRVYWPVMPVALMAAFLFCLWQDWGNCRQSERLLSMTR